MKEFKDKVAVITGAASGIGRALADRSAQEGMKVVLADVEEEALTKAEASIKATGATVLAFRTDVSQATEIEALAQKTLNAFGSVHLLCNNAGVAGKPVSVWENTMADWEWVMSVNLWSVIHGLRVFVPIMLAQDSECHVVNTASMAGLISHPGLAPYKVTKHGVVTLSETLHHELTELGAKVKVSVLCPGIVKTRIMESERNRPRHLLATEPSSLASGSGWEILRQLVQAGMPPAQVAEAVFKAIREERFYILTHPEDKEAVRTRMEDILQERNPTHPGDNRKGCSTMASIYLKPEEALVLIEFLLRFRDQEKLSIEHCAEANALWDLCAVLESQVPELVDPAYAQLLEKARAAVASSDWE
jgi:NAD(P)-dependent dehydrogenase (short-subunit alcohol dehydrogenase family)